MRRKRKEMERLYPDFERLYRQGANFKAIARICGVNTRQVKNWANKRHLPSLYEHPKQWEAQDI